jgi:hypothetical protein
MTVGVSFLGTGSKFEQRSSHPYDEAATRAACPVLVEGFVDAHNGEAAFEPCRDEIARDRTRIPVRVCRSSVPAYTTMASGIAGKSSRFTTVRFPLGTQKLPHSRR